MPYSKAKKAKSPTGRASKVSSSLAPAMKGKGGKRTSAYSGTAKAGKSNYRAEKMDKGLPLTRMEEDRKRNKQARASANRRMKTNY